jgi:hypothetical protein
MIGSKFKKEDTQELDVQMAKEFLQEISEFISKLMANQKSINQEFSSELEFYLNEAEWVTNQLQLAL